MELAVNITKHKTCNTKHKTQDLLHVTCYMMKGGKTK